MDSEFDKSFEQALRFLKYSDRTVHEMKDKLREKGFSEDAVNYAAEKLKKLGFLDDRKFAERWIRGKMRSRPIGRRLIRQQLRLKGIHPEVIDEKLRLIYEEFSESEGISAIIRKQMGKYKSLETQELRKKLFAFLLRRGFDYDECVSAVERIVKSKDDN